MMRKPPTIQATVYADAFQVMGALVAHFVAAELREQADYFDQMADATLPDPRRYTAPWN